jgi:hypothetical protein
MLKSQVDVENRLIHIPDSKTPDGIGDMPMTEPAFSAIKEQVAEADGSAYYFSLYELRHPCATRFSAGAWRTLLLR